jgi:hypothetical protein
MYNIIVTEEGVFKVVTDKQLESYRNYDLMESGIEDRADAVSILEDIREEQKLIAQEKAHEVLRYAY